MTLSYHSPAGIAQMVEQRFCNPQVPRSIRGAGTNNIFKYSLFVGILMKSAA